MGKSPSASSERDAYRIFAEASHQGFARVQRYEPGSADDPGEWIFTSPSRKQRPREDPPSPKTARNAIKAKGRITAVRKISHKS
jgi:hypothetical protein